MKRKRAENRALGLRDVTTPLPETIIAEIDAEGERREFSTRGATIAIVWQEWKQMKQAQEQATT